MTAMSVIKINHLTNLQDARYCAAMNLDYVGFCMERGHVRKMAEETIAEIAEWLSGPQVVLDFGADVEGLQDWHTRYPGDGRLLQMNYDAAAHTLPAGIPLARLILTVAVPEKGGLPDEALLALGSQGALLELVPAGRSKAIITRLNALFAQSHHLLLNLDATGARLLPELTARPYGVAFRDIASTGAYELDYDKTEAVIEAFRGYV
ncbi:MAG: hypothetical protein KF690_08215 [Bacteroidetes bacterium]|nr:hypothetical protein [Bacteroidota bacterium]